MTSSEGIFRFPNLGPGTYSVAVKANGFKEKITSDIELGGSESRDLGRLALDVGSINQTVEVTAAVTPIQTSSGEKSAEITGSALSALPLKGRDLFGSLKLVPGVIDTNTSRDVPSSTAIGGITINGNTSAINFTVDGISAIDTGSNGSLDFEPNMDSIQEVKILGSNYQAEFGRNSGGTITVVTKSGTQQFHGSSWWSHRNEDLNANDYFNKQKGLPRPKYRYNLEGWSIGGPAFIPRKFNTGKNKLFFFASQEYTGQLVPSTTQVRTTPTAIERGSINGVPTTTPSECGVSGNPAVAGCADFSQSVNSAGKVIKIIDPTTGSQFPGNIIPASRLSAYGQAMLNFFPLPNFTPAPGTQYYNQANFAQDASGAHPHRDTAIRIDVVPTSKLTAFFRYTGDYDVATTLFQYSQFNIAPISHPHSGYGYEGSAVYTISPSLVNEFIIGKNWDTSSYYFINNNQNLVLRSVFGNPPTLLPLPASNFQNTPTPAANGYYNAMSSYSFGSDRPNFMSFSTGTGPYFNENPIWTYEDNITKVAGAHQFKAGVYLENNYKLQPAGNNYAGTFSFATDSNNPLDSGDGFANTLLGNYDSFSQQTKRTEFIVKYWNVEFYVQDNWRIKRRLTLDYGIRFYHQTPQIDYNNAFAEFVPSVYDPADTSRIYVPACTIATRPCPNANLRSQDPGNPSAPLTPSSYIGDYVPDTGNPANGMVALGTKAPYTQSWLAPAPRIGAAYDVFGNGKTALRGGFGVYFDRLDGNQVYNMSGQPPIAYTYLVSNGNINNLTGASPVLAPTSISYFGGSVPWLVVRNASVGIQQSLGFKTVLDVAWVGNYGRHLNFRQNLNPVPLAADFQPSNISSVTHKALTQVSSSLERVNYPGMLDINRETFAGLSSYNALQVSVQRRLSKGFLVGGSYAWSKALAETAFDPLVPDNRVKNYGPTSADRRQSLQINYSYELPNLGRRLNSKLLGVVTDRWTISGLTSFIAGPPIMVTASLGGTDITGSTSEAPRPNIISNPKANVPAGFIFNPNAFAAPTQGTAAGCGPTCLGNEGLNPFYGRGTNNFDVTMSKFIPIGLGETRGFQLQVQAYNVFNHPQFNSGYSTTANFNSSQTGPTNATSLGTATTDNLNPSRIIGLSLRFQF